MSFLRLCSSNIRIEDSLHNIDERRATSLDECIEICASWNILYGDREKKCNIVSWRNRHDVGVPGLCMVYRRWGEGEGVDGLRVKYEESLDSAVWVNEY